MLSKKVSMIAAMCEGNGIGFNGSLPWRLKNELAFFTRITSDTLDKSKKNAVIMGRKSWDSIPIKYKPLPGRINVVISRRMTANEQCGRAIFGRLNGGQNDGDEVVIGQQVDANGTKSAQPDHVFDSLANCIAFLNQQENIESIFIIGGQQLYQLGLKEPTVKRIYLTRIHSSFECDTFFPNIDHDQWSEVNIPSVPKEDQVEKDIRYNFHVYDKNN